MEEHDIFIEKINEILKRQLTQKSFDLWTGICGKISNSCWEKPTSSTGKYHQKEDGRVPTVAEHTYEMIYSADKIIPMFDGMINKDIIFLSIALHDSYKYGLVKTCKHTEQKHDQIVGDIIRKNKKVFVQALESRDVDLLEESVRFHTGRWSTDAKPDFKYSDYNSIVLFLSTLDMLSSKNLLKVK